MTHPLPYEIEDKIAALELDLALGRFKTADPLRDAVWAWVEDRVRAALAQGRVVPVEAIVRVVLRPPPTQKGS